MQIFIGNIGPEVSEDEIRLAFEQFGPVKQARVCRDRVTGRPRGFGFVSMDPMAGGLAAIAELDGAIIGSGRRPVVVQKSNQLR